MIDYELIDLFKRDSVKKDLIVTDGDSVNLTNANIYTESFELTEMLCSEEDLVFGSCNAACLKFTTSYLGELKGKILTVSVILDDNTDNPFQFGVYKVYEDTLSADRTKKEIVAYDALYDIINANVMDWYNTELPNIDSSETLKEFRDSFFNYFNISQETIDLDNDSMTVTKTVGGNTLSGAEVIRSICATNGCFGRINRSGNFEYFYLKPIGRTGLYPSLVLYPSTSLYPLRHQNASEVGESGKYIKAKYEDYEVSKISKLIIRDSDDELIIEVGNNNRSGDNAYVMGNNLLLYDKSAEDITTVATNIFDRIKDIYYTPCKIELKGNPCYEIGDGVYVDLIDGSEIVTYISTRTYKGIQAQRDTFIAEGQEKRTAAVNGIDSQLYQLKGKSNKLERNLEYTISTLTDESLDPDQNPLALRSYIKQTAGEVETKVSKTSPTGQTSFSWNMSDTQMEWKANNSQIMLLNSSGLKITGEVNASTGNIGGWTINNNEISTEYQSGGTHTKICLQSDGSLVCYDKNNSDAVKWALKRDGDCIISGNATIAGYMKTTDIYTGTLTANQITTGTLDCSNLTVTNLSASSITSGSMSGARITTGTITADKLDANSMESSDLYCGTLRSLNSFIWFGGTKYVVCPINEATYGWKIGT